MNKYRSLVFICTLICIYLLFAHGQICIAEIPQKPLEWEQWSFDQKIFWRGQHLDSRIPYAAYVDKVKVKEIVSDSILTTKTLFTTDDPELITTYSLPRNYIMKANNASGRGLLILDGMVVASKKRDVDFVPVNVSDSILKAYATEWLSVPYQLNIENQYGLIKPMILFEEYLDNIKMDIELFCFRGRVKLIEILFMESYKSIPVISFYDAKWNLLETTHPVHQVLNEPLAQPVWLDNLFDFVRKYTSNIDHVRVDFYLNGEDIYFGEFTFTTGGGVVSPIFQTMLGRCWKFPNPPSEKKTYDYLDLLNRLRNQNKDDIS